MSNPWDYSQHYVPDWSEADPSAWPQETPPWYAPVWDPRSQKYLQDIALRGALEDKARQERINQGKGKRIDYTISAAGTPLRLAEGLVHLPESIYSGATLPGDVVSGKYNPTPIMDSDDPNDPNAKYPFLTQKLKEEELNARVMDTAGLATMGGGLAHGLSSPKNLIPKGMYAAPKEAVPAAVALTAKREPLFSAAERTVDESGLKAIQHGFSLYASNKRGVAAGAVALSASGRPLPKRLYHYTDAKNAESIRREGFRSNPDYIFEDTDPRPGVNFVSDKGHDIPPRKKGAVRFVIDPSKLDPKKFESKGSGWHRYIGDVPPEAIVRVETAEGGPTLYAGGKKAVGAAALMGDYTRPYRLIAPDRRLTLKDWEDYLNSEGIEDISGLSDAEKIDRIRQTKFGNDEYKKLQFSEKKPGGLPEYNKGEMHDEDPTPPRYLYHQTDDRVANTIQKEGLKASKDWVLGDYKKNPAGVNFVTHPDFLYQGDTPTDHWFMVDTSKLDKSKWINMGAGWFRYKGSVHPNHFVKPDTTLFSGGKKATAVGAAASTIRALHSSPYDFNKFSLEKMGSGEGYRDYGWGVYLGEAHGVSGKGGFYDKQFSSHPQAKKNWTKEPITYHVDIKAHPDSLLDWDVPIGKQSATIRGTFSQFDPKMTGEDVIKSLGGGPDSSAASAKKVSMDLLGNGVNGIKYLDKRSRLPGATTKTYNYTIFDADKLHIANKQYTKLALPKPRKDYTVKKGLRPYERFLKKYPEHHDALTPNDLKALAGWSDDHYRPIAKHIYKGQPLAPQYQWTINQLDDMFERVSLPTNLVLWRGVSHDTAAILAKLQPGDFYNYPGYQSTSLSRRTSKDWKPVLIKIVMPKDSKALVLGHLSANATEDEVLLPRNLPLFYQGRDAYGVPNFAPAGEAKPMPLTANKPIEGDVKIPGMGKMTKAPTPEEIESASDFIMDNDPEMNPDTMDNMTKMGIVQHAQDLGWQPPSKPLSGQKLADQVSDLMSAKEFLLEQGQTVDTLLSDPKQIIEEAKSYGWKAPGKTKDFGDLPAKLAEHPENVKDALNYLLDNDVGGEEYTDIQVVKQALDHGWQPKPDAELLVKDSKNVYAAKQFLIDKLGVHPADIEYDMAGNQISDLDNVHNALVEGWQPKTVKPAGGTKYTIQEENVTYGKTYSVYENTPNGKKWTGTSHDTKAEAEDYVKAQNEPPPIPTKPSTNIKVNIEKALEDAGFKDVGSAGSSSGQHWFNDNTHSSIFTHDDGNWQVIKDGDHVGDGWGLQALQPHLETELPPVDIANMSFEEFDKGLTGSPEVKPTQYVVEGNGPWAVYDSETGQFQQDFNNKQQAEIFAEELNKGPLDQNYPNLNTSNLTKKLQKELVKIEKEMGLHNAEETLNKLGEITKDKEFYEVDGAAFDTKAEAEDYVIQNYGYGNNETDY